MEQSNMFVTHMFGREQLIFQGELMLRIFISCILGLAIGYERKNRNKGAGIRTHAIVALGASLIMIVSKYGFTDIPDYDAARVAAQVVSGIGFLGAGIIFVRNNSISGLTTAAGIWATAGVGLAVGSGLYLIGIASTVLVVLAQVVMHRVKFLAREPYSGLIKVTLKKSDSSIGDFQKILKREKIEAAAMKITKTEDTVKIELDAVFPPTYDKHTFIAQMAKRDEILEIKG